MSISPPPTFVQVHLALQSIHPHIAYLSAVCTSACSRNSVYDVNRRKGIASASGQSVSALAGLLTGEIIRWTRLFADRGAFCRVAARRESFGLVVPEEGAQFKSGPTLSSAVSSGTLLSGFPPNKFPSRSQSERMAKHSLTHQQTSGLNRVLV